jgi:histidinol phosphatase-like PHP family hydrolase
MSDGDLPIEEVVALAADIGVRIGIADHVSARNPRQFISDSTKLDRYLSVIKDAGVLRSAELCWLDSFGASLPESVLNRFDYVIGSNHGFFLPDGTFASPWWQELPPAWSDRADDLMSALVDNLCQLVTTMPISIVAHSTLIPPALFAIEPDVEAWWTEEREERFVMAAVNRGVAIEISNRYRLPHRRILERARAAGARFSLGSDGHTRPQIGQLGWAVNAAREAGIGDDNLFVPRES